MKMQEVQVLQRQIPNTQVTGNTATCTLWYTPQGDILGVADFVPDSDGGLPVALRFDAKGACPMPIHEEQELTPALQEVFRKLERYRQGI